MDTRIRNTEYCNRLQLDDTGKQHKPLYKIRTGNQRNICKNSGGGIADDEPAVPDERMVIIDVHACGVEAGEGIELTFELISICSGWYTVGDDLKVRVSFAQVSSELGEELANYVGERFYIEASNNGECWFGPVPASGNIEAELV